MGFFISCFLVSSMMADPQDSAPLNHLSPTLPEGFVRVREVIPDIRVDLRYATPNNFIGKPVDGYHAHHLILTRDAAAALKDVQDALRPYELTLKVFDGYRPQRAVDHFVRWSTEPDDHIMKPSYYPKVDKADLFDAGYIARRSGHSRGSAIDLTIASKNFPHAELDMGTPFDFFDPASRIDSPIITPQQKANRLLLRTLMIQHGFKPYQEEWWHFSLMDEPFPNRYFDFAISEEHHSPESKE
ncbi:MAG: M15 family metallopeptidase [Verrucomicrobia bacterium]|nr:M15 family metallopeptidase [Verrucomicrobiota bacterium]